MAVNVDKTDIAVAACLELGTGGSSIVFLCLVDPGLFYSFFLGPHCEDSGDGANTAVSGRVGNSHEGGGHPYAAQLGWRWH